MPRETSSGAQVGDHAARPSLIGCRGVWVTATQVLLAFLGAMVVSVAPAWTAPQDSPLVVDDEALYAIQGSAYPHVYTLDSESGELLTSVSTGTDFPLSGLTSRNSHIYSFRGVNSYLRDDLCALHRADLRLTVRGPTGQDWNWRSPDFDPRTGTLYCVGDQKLYTVDPDTGTATLIAPLSTGSADFINSFGIAPTGEAFAFGGCVWRVDLSNGHCVPRPISWTVS